ncbi:DUF2800 domain-containing protein [Schaalia sp. lx-100]|uniref:DUF2800 domain-containing protein n=1 Tax=Schaalia sp. lx-100 TaxID=2899081 RepID=UPI001E2E7D60|nr:DUF2800 domain-containing protein [Schaalia sp. lx-100]MCD4557336.1 DUF2800 domain-containing protein [Schaalia sp. lx-100]
MPPGNHALLSASSSHRWLNCTPSARLEADLPDSETQAAAQGTTAHALAEWKLRKALGQETGTRPADGWVDEEMETHTDDYVDYVLTTLAKARESCPDARVLVEQRLDYSYWVPGGFGTGDCVIVAEPVLHVIDFKYGQGVLVEAAENPQMKLYALGALHLFEKLWDIHTIELTIFQPRRHNLSTWTTPITALKHWARHDLSKAAKLAAAGEGEFCPGAWCTFCKLAPTCRARAEQQMELARYEFKAAPQLTDSEVADILTRLPELTKWANDIQTHALSQAAEHGKRYPGFKLVAGRTVRKYTDEAEVAAAAEAAGFTNIWRKNLLPVTGLEKAMGRKRFAEVVGPLITKPPGKPTLVPETDPRPELTAVSAADEFTPIHNNIPQGEKHEQH